VEEPADELLRRSTQPPRNGGFGPFTRRETVLRREERHLAGRRW
jgi:hypothetical protein